MRLAEREAPLYEVVRDIGRERESLARCGTHPVEVEGERRQHGREDAQRRKDHVRGAEDVRLVLLEVTVVSHRQALHRGQDANEFGDGAAAAATSQFGHVRVLLLRHDARTGGKTIRERHEAVFSARPEDDVLAEAGDVDLRDGAGRCELRHKVAVGGRIHAVPGNCLEAELPGHHLPIERIRRTGERSRTEREHIGAAAAVEEPLAVAQEHLSVGEEMMAQRDGLRPLDVRIAGHCVGSVLFAKVANDADEGSARLRGDVTGFPDDHPVQQRDLVVARTGGMQTAGCGANLRAKQRLDVRVNVFELRLPRHAASLDVGKHFAQSGDDRLRVGCGDDALFPQHPGVGHRPRNVVRPEVTVHAGRVLLGQFVHPAFETPAPGPLFSQPTPPSAHSSRGVPTHHRT